MNKERDLLPWIFGGLSAAAIAVAFAAVSTHRAEATLPSPVAAAHDPVPQVLPPPTTAPAPPQATPQALTQTAPAAAPPDSALNPSPPACASRDGAASTGRADLGMHDEGCEDLFQQSLRREIDAARRRSD